MIVARLGVAGYSGSREAVADGSEVGGGQGSIFWRGGWLRNGRCCAVKLSIR